jgi:predicted transposase/invertase (TIGR01784 family)
MYSTDSKKDNWFLNIDFSQLMDLRVDYAFKLLFGMGDTLFLISLLNAVFANKKFRRIIKSLTIINPYLEKQSKGDKLSVLDIMAQLDDGSTILIEMHLYDIDDLKYKTIRSWARAYGEELKEGEKYLTQPPVICVSFVNGSMDDSESQKIHKCCKILDIDDHTIFSDSLELHYIDMKAYVKTINEKGGIGKGETVEAILAKWLAVITEKDIKDKTIIKDSCKDQEEIGMAVSALVRLSEDKITRQAYQKRLDEIMLYNNRINAYKRRAEHAESALADKDAALADKDAALADKDATLADQAKQIAELRSLLDGKFITSS